MEYLKDEFHKATWDDFNRKLPIANQAEAVIIKHLENEGANILEDGTKNGTKEYDVLVEYLHEYDDTLISYEYKYEIKVDYASAYTGNAFIEIIQNGKDSGIMTTEADKYIVVSPSATTTSHVCTFIDVVKLRKEMVKYPQRTCGRAMGYIIPIKELKEMGYVEKIKLTDETHFAAINNNYYKKIKNARIKDN